MNARVDSRRRGAGQGSARIGRSEWIRGAMDLLVREGIAGVRVEPLAVRLNVTKGSFYWHFADRDALHAAMLDQWRSIATRAIIVRLEGGGGVPRAKLRRLIAITARGSEADGSRSAESAKVHDPVAID